jgi:hypothetical protein
METVTAKGRRTEECPAAQQTQGFELRGSVDEIDGAVYIEQWGKEHRRTSETEELRLSDIDGNLELTDTTETAKNNVLHRLNWHRTQVD